MEMKAPLTRGGAFQEVHAFPHVLALLQPRYPFFSCAHSARCSSAHHKRASAMTTRTVAAKPEKHRAFCHSCAAVSSLSSDQRLEFTLSVGSMVIPHPAKVEKGGEDAFFVSNHNGGTVGIADGVSGWAEKSIDPALFSRELMEHAVTALDGELVGDCPRQLLAKAHEATLAIGAATVIVAILEREGGVLHIANLGDCGLRLLRKGSIVFATSTQEHYFDCPYQLSSEPGAQTSVDAMVHKVELLPEDIIVMGSDGLFDNVYDKDIEKTIRLFEGSDLQSPQKIASALAALASKHAKDLKYESPYSEEAILQGYDVPFWKRILGEKLTGGKLDDITVLTAQVVATPILPKIEPAATSEEEASVPSQEAEEALFPPQVTAATPVLPEVGPVVSSDEDTSTSILPKIQPVAPTEGEASVPPQAAEEAFVPAQRAAATSILPKVEPVSPNEEEASVPPQATEEASFPPQIVAATPILPEVEPVVSCDKDASVPPVEEIPGIDSPPNELLARAA